MKYLLILIFGYCSIYGNSEELPTFKLPQLAIFSERIVEAQFIQEKEGDYLFFIRDLKDSSVFKDTLVTDRMAGFDYFKNPEEGFKTTDKFILFLSSYDDGRNGKKKLMPILSGVRLYRKDRIFLPAQVENPGGMYFMASSDTMTWQTLKENVMNVQDRVFHAKSLKNIPDPIEKNQALLQWIKENKNSFWDDECGWNSDCGWGSLVWESFDWITETNIAEDTWEAFLLSIDINANSKYKWRQNNVRLEDKNGSSFKTYKDISFLVGIATDPKANINYRNQALRYLSQAVNKVYENNYPIPDSTQLFFQQQKQKGIRDTAFVLMKIPELKESAFGVVRRLSNPREGGLKHRIDLELLPAIIEIYRNEEFSAYKTSLADFIIYNSNEKEWKAITGNDAKIFIQIPKYRYVDTVKQLFTCDVLFRNGTPIVHQIPKVVFQREDIEKAPLTLEIDSLSFKLPFKRYDGNRRLKFDISKFKKGQYSFYFFGKAGEENEFDWKSEVGSFKIE